MAKSTKSSGGGKPDKPHKDYPLFAQSNGQWAKARMENSTTSGCGTIQSRLWPSGSAPNVDSRDTRSHTEQTLAARDSSCRHPPKPETTNVQGAVFPQSRKQGDAMVSGRFTVAEASPYDPLRPQFHRISALVLTATAWWLSISTGYCGQQAASGRVPNIVLVLTDDQGYGDLGCHGNKILKTPNLDRLYQESIRLTDFHVDPTCSPTRAALMTGRYSCRAGVWHTIMGRSFLRRDEVTLADMFAGAWLSNGHLWQVAPGRQLPLPDRRPRIPGVVGARWRRNRPDGRLLGQ